MDGYDINEEVIKYIANNIKSNIRELEGAINKVMAFAKLEKKEVTLELAEQALKDIISPDEKKSSRRIILFPWLLNILMLQWMTSVEISVTPKL